MKSTGKKTILQRILSVTLSACISVGGCVAMLLPVHTASASDAEQSSCSVTNTAHEADESSLVCGQQATCKSCGEPYGEVVEHRYTDLIEFVWGEASTTCKYRVRCSLCGEENPELLDAVVEENLYFGGVRAEYVAIARMTYTDANGEKQIVTKTSDPVRYFIVKIEDTIGINASSVPFTAEKYEARSLINNTRLKDSEFEAYFCIDGEVVGTTAYLAGTYDILVVGKENYEYQEYLYEDFFTIEPVEVDMNISIADRVADGSRDYKFVLSFDGEYDYSHLIGIYAHQNELPSAEAGEYEITGIGIYFKDEAVADSITINYNETATAKLLPKKNVAVKNESYKTEYTYNGEPIPEPEAGELSVDEGSELRFVWFRDESFGLVRLSGAPTDAGNYVLRVMASATGEYLSGSTDINVRIDPTKLTLSVDSYENYKNIIEEEWIDNDFDGVDDTLYGTTVWYVFDMGEMTDPYKQGLVKVTGLVGDDTLESEGIWLGYRISKGENSYSSVSSEFPVLPRNGNYYAEVTLGQSNIFGSTANYTWESTEGARFYFIINPPKDSVVADETDIVYSGSNLNFDLLVSYAQSSFVETYAEQNPQLTYATTVNTSSDFNATEVSKHSFYLDANEKHTAFAKVSIPGSGTYYTRTQVDTEYFYDENEVWGSKSEILMLARLTVSITDGQGNEVSRIKNVGTYTVTVKTEHLDADGVTVNKTETSSAEVRVVPEVKDLYIIVKESEINLNGEMKQFDVKDIVFIPEYTLDVGHSIVDLTYEVEVGGYAGAYNCGYITIKDWVIEDEEGNDVSDWYNIISYGYQWYQKDYDINIGFGTADWKHAEGYNGIIHIYSDPCDATCNIEGCTATREPAAHYGGEAKCIEKAVCEGCGQEYGTYDTSKHETDKLLYVQDENDPHSHKVVNSCCGNTVRLEEHTFVKDATCITLGECSLCGVVEGYYDHDNHNSTDMYYRINPSDNSMHDYAHVCCDAVETSETHTEGVAATCTDKAICDVCELSYGLLDPSNHSSDKYTYEATDTDANRHTKNHACCGAYVGIETHSGGTATCNKKAACDACGAGYGDLDPDNHASEELKYTAALVGNLHYISRACCGASVGSEEHSGGSANCIEKAKCEHCGDEYGILDPSVHASDKVRYAASMTDPDKHDKIADCCGVLLATEEHSGGEATCSDKAKCSLCAEGYGELADHKYDDACDSTCNECGADRLAGHTDKNGDGVCDKCGETVSHNDNNEDGTTDKTDETETADNTGGGGDGQNSGCGASVGLGAVSVIISVIFAGATLVKRKKES